MTRIYLSPPHATGRESELVTDAIASNWLAPLGPHVDEFESEFSDVVQVPNALALSSGTAALHLALVVLGIGPGDEVVCSSLTFAASANAIRYTGAATVFVDCDSATWTMDPNLLDEALADRRRRGGRVRAVLAVDLYGQCCDYDALRAVCERHDVFLLQDAAESVGATYGGRPSGSQGLLAAFSFNGNKIITTSGGGMLVSADESLIEHARKLSTQARDPAPHYEHSELGFNYRLSNVLAALGRAQLAALPDRVAARRAVNVRYRDASRGRARDYVHARGRLRHEQPLAHVHRRRSRAVRCRPRSDPRRSRGARHRGQARLETDAPAAVFRARPVLRWRRLGAPFRKGSLSPERLRSHLRRSGPRCRGPSQRFRAPSL